MHKIKFLNLKHWEFCSKSEEAKQFGYEFKDIFVYLTRNCYCVYIFKPI